MIMRRILTIGLALVAASATAGEPASSDAPAPPLAVSKNDPLKPPPAEPPRGSLVVVGGALRYKDPEIWKRVVGLASEYARRSGIGSAARPRIAVVAAASSFPARTGQRVVEAFNQNGADAFVVPVGLKDFPVDYRQAAADPAVVSQLQNCHGVFLTGGEQSRILQTLRTADGVDTPVLKAIWEMYRAGGVVAGTSAGAAVTSNVTFRDAERVLPVLLSGVKMGKEIDRGLGFMDPDWLLDQHFIIRGRFARALVAMRQREIKFGLGVDENTALVVRGPEAEVIGYKGTLLLDLSQAEHDPADGRFNLRGARLSYLDRGDSFNLKTRAIVPSPEKQSGEKIDPNSESFRPQNDEPMSTNDILMNSSVLDLMCKLMDNKRSEAIGLAFDGQAARNSPTPGFEFKLSRGKDTAAWFTGAFSGGDLTVVNVHLDVRPIQINAPLYK